MAIIIALQALLGLAGTLVYGLEKLSTAQCAGDEPDRVISA